jgi:hypothetical protein
MYNQRRIARKVKEEEESDVLSPSILNIFSKGNSRGLDQLLNRR